MKSVTSITLIFCVSLFSFCQSNQQINDKDLTSKTRDVASFTGIKVQNSIHLILTQGNPSVVSVITTDPDDQDKVSTEVENGILHIKLENNNWNWRNKKIEIHVTMPTINSLEATGASSIKVIDKILTEAIKIELSGASSLKGEIKTIKLNADINGASSLKINGIAQNVEIEASGASSFNGYEFECENANIEASGASSINIGISKNLIAKASGASSIKYKGNPAVKELKNSGASSIKQKQD